MTVTVDDVLLTLLWAVPLLGAFVVLLLPARLELAVWVEERLSVVARQLLAVEVREVLLRVALGSREFQEILPGLEPSLPSLRE